MQSEQTRQSRQQHRFWSIRNLWPSTRTALRPSGPAIPDDVARYLNESYPSNHNYRVRGGALSPRRKLAARYRKQRPYYLAPLTSLLDLSCSKGFYVLSAAAQGGCERAAGIDICDEELRACEAVRKHLCLHNATFANLKLHQLAARIDEFGGPFQMVLLCNSYQYLFFGSQRCPDRYETHAEIFAMMHKVCSGRVIFNNRTDLEDCQRSTRHDARESGREAEYNSQAITAAASKYFHVAQHGNVGGYPLWTLDAR
jgi:hypothetical protein